MGGDAPDAGVGQGYFQSRIVSSAMLVSPEAKFLRPIYEYQIRPDKKNRHIDTMPILNNISLDLFSDIKSNNCLIVSRQQIIKEKYKKV
jgi:hypothetical protein